MTHRSRTRTYFEVCDAHGHAVSCFTRRREADRAAERFTRVTQERYTVLARRYFLCVLCRTPTVRPGICRYHASVGEGTAVKGKRFASGPPGVAPGC